MTQLTRIDGSLIAESDTLTMVELVELNKADLSGANLYMANLSKANLSDASLYMANLSKANLSEASLYNADLSGANLYNADLCGAYLYGANISRAKGIVQFGPVPTSGRIGYCVDHGDKIMVKLGCWWGALDETLDRISEKHPNEKGEAYADMVKSAARSLEVER